MNPFVQNIDAGLKRLDLRRARLCFVLNATQLFPQFLDLFALLPYRASDRGDGGLDPFLQGLSLPSLRGRWRRDRLRLRQPRGVRCLRYADSAVERPEGNLHHRISVLNGLRWQSIDRTGTP